jgi:hypothetical protein
MNKNDQDNKDLLNKLEQASPEEAKNLVVQSLVPECRGVASSFFDCIEEKIKTIEDKNMDFKQMEREFNDNFTPACMKNFDLESCLKKYSPEH